MWQKSQGKFPFQCWFPMPQKCIKQEHNGILSNFLLLVLYLVSYGWISLDIWDLGLRDRLEPYLSFSFLRNYHNLEIYNHSVFTFFMLNIAIINFEFCQKAYNWYECLLEYVWCCWNFFYSLYQKKKIVGIFSMVVKKHKNKGLESLVSSNK